LEPAAWLAKSASDPALVKTWQDANHLVVCRHVPAEEFSILDLQLERPGAKASQEEFERRATEYRNAWYVRFSFSLLNGQNLETWGMSNETEYQQRLHRLQQEIAAQFVMRQDNGREFSPLSCEYLRTFGMTAECTFLLAFPLPESKTEEVTIQYKDREFGIPQEIQFNFDLQATERALPDLRLGANNLLESHDFQKPPHPQGDCDHTLRNAAV
jgi:hypothetical protein